MQAKPLVELQCYLNKFLINGKTIGFCFWKKLYIALLWVQTLVLLWPLRHHVWVGFLNRSWIVLKWAGWPNLCNICYEYSLSWKKWYQIGPCNGLNLMLSMYWYDNHIHNTRKKSLKFQNLCKQILIDKKNCKRVRLTKLKKKSFWYSKHIQTNISHFQVVFSVLSSLEMTTQCNEIRMKNRWRSSIHV